MTTTLPAPCQAPGCHLPLANPGVFWTVQGEGALLGEPTVFIRLAGCSVGCRNCDTDYRVASRATVGEILAMVQAIRSPARWIWITGGEPMDHDLTELLAALRQTGRRIALATSGIKSVRWPLASWVGGVDFLSVSPHSVDGWAQREGDQLNLVPGLNGLSLDVIREAALEFGGRFAHRYVTPLAGSPESLASCLDWVGRYKGWRLGVQAHKAWGLP